MTNQTRTEPLDRLAVTRQELVDLLDAHLPRMAFRQYGQMYNDDPDFDVVEYYERVVAAIFAAAAPSLIAEAREAARLRSALEPESLMEIVSDSLAATTEGTDWAEAPEPSDEPGSPYVRRLTNEILSHLRAALVRP